MKEPETYPLPAQVEKELEKARSHARIQAAKLKNQLERYDRLALEFKETKARLKKLEAEHETELKRLSQKHEQAMARKKRQNDLILEQMAGLEAQVNNQPVDEELKRLRLENEQLKADNELLSHENELLGDELMKIMG